MSRSVRGLLLAAVYALACEGQGAGAAPGDELRGEVEVRIVDHFDGTSTRDYRLVTSDGPRPRRLAFDEDPGLEPGTQLAVWAAAQSEGTPGQAAGIERVK